MAATVATEITNCFSGTNSLIEILPFSWMKSGLYEAYILLFKH
jgi:hypothetical protein